MPKGAPVDIAEAHKDEPVDLLRPKLDERLQAAADKSHFTQHKPHKTTESAETNVNQRRDSSSEARTIDKFFHSSTNLATDPVWLTPHADTSAAVFQISGTGLVAKGVAQG